MCYGNLDPKYAMRETEARLKSISFQSIARVTETEKAPASAPALWPGAWVRAAVARLTRKDRAHV